MARYSPGKTTGVRRMASNAHAALKRDLTSLLEATAAKHAAAPPRQWLLELLWTVDRFNSDRRTNFNPAQTVAQYARDLHETESEQDWRRLNR